MELKIYVPDKLWELLLTEAAEREISVEEIISEAIKHYLERNKSNGK